jgi:hypothetical protein
LICMPSPFTSCFCFYTVRHRSSVLLYSSWCPLVVSSVISNNYGLSTFKITVMKVPAIAHFFLFSNDSVLDVRFNIV